MLSRPALDEVLVYRQYVDALIELGCHHEQQHQELILTDVKHLLSRNPLKPVYQKQWPQTRWQFSGLRLARDVQKDVPS